VLVVQAYLILFLPMALIQYSPQLPRQAAVVVKDSLTELQAVVDQARIELTQ
jgi:hypothetical protein